MTMTNLARLCARVGLAGVLLVGATDLLSAQDDDRSVAVHVGRLIVGNGEEQEDVTILIQGGKIEAIGPNMELPYPCEEVDARHLTAMPGLVHPSSRLGLLSYSRSGLQGHRRVADEFLPEDASYKDAREAGYTTLVLVPGGTSGIPGRSMAIRTADVGQGYVLNDDLFLSLNLRNPASDKRALRDALDNAQKEIDKVKKAREDFEKKQKEAADAAAKKAKEEEAKKQQEKPKEGGGKAAEDPPKKDAPNKEEAKAPEFKAPAIRKELQPLVDLLEKKPGALGVIEITSASSYLHLQDVLKKHEVPYVLSSNTGSAGRFSTVDLFFVAEQLGENEETVLVAPSLVNYPYSIDKVNLAQQLVEAGVTVAFAPFSDSGTALAAMRYQAGEVIKGGLDRNEAIKALTLHVAQAVGLGDQVGSVETGKSGNLMLLSGDPFDVQTRVEQVMIEGTVVYDRDENGR